MIQTFNRSLILFSLTFVFIGCGEFEPGPLRVSDVNPRYFTDNSGRAIYMTGSHTWASLMDMGPSDPPAPFDYDAYLDFMEGYGHNFKKLWTWELVNWNTVANASSNRSKEPEVHTVSPLPWKRTGPGVALDGKPKFDLTQYNDEYFKRLRNRILAPEGGDMVVDLSAGTGEIEVDWFDPSTGETRTGDTVAAGGRRTFSSPFGEEDCVLYLKLL